MKYTASIFIAIFALLIPVALCIPSVDDVNGVALEYIRSSSNYVDNGGFGEEVRDTKLGEDLSVVVVKYQTRHVGMLQMIGNFVSYVTINSSTLEVIDCITEATCEVEEPGNWSSSDGGNWTDGYPGNWTDTDPDDWDYPGSGDEGYRLKISYLINMTRDLIQQHAGEADFTEALGFLDKAQEVLDGGDFEGALDLALRAEDIVNRIIYGDGDEPVGTEPGSDAPWLHGYIVVFHNEPTKDDWDELGTLYNATFAGEAGSYCDESNAYWVEVSGTSPDQLKLLEGVKDVLALRTGPEQPGDGSETGGDEMTDVPEVFLWASLTAAALLVIRVEVRKYAGKE